MSAKALTAGAEEFRKKYQGNTQITLSLKRF